MWACRARCSDSDKGNYECTSDGGGDPFTYLVKPECARHCGASNHLGGTGGGFVCSPPDPATVDPNDAPTLRHTCTCAGADPSLASHERTHVVTGVDSPTTDVGSPTYSAHGAQCLEVCTFALCAR